MSQTGLGFNDSLLILLDHRILNLMKFPRTFETIVDIGLISKVVLGQLMVLMFVLWSP